MFTLIYNNGQFNEPDTLIPFLLANVENSPLIQIDCIMPYKGSPEEMMAEVCVYLSKQNIQIEVLPNTIQNSSTESTTFGRVVNYLVIQIDVRNR